jgi:hypothetical protein
MTVSPPVAAASASRQIVCANRPYVIRRFEDGVFAVYDDAGKLLAGWPLTALWPDQALSAKTDEEWCGLIRGIYAH